MNIEYQTFNTDHKISKIEPKTFNIKHSILHIEHWSLEIEHKTVPLVSTGVVARYWEKLRLTLVPEADCFYGGVGLISVM